MYTATSFGYGEDFVITPIKCPPPKIVAVKRSLKSKLKSNIMDDENDSDVKDDFINEEEENESKDLIEFEREEEPLIDLSDNSSSDTLEDMNEKNSNGKSSTITMLLDLLEIGSIINNNKSDFVCKKEREDCAGYDCASLPTSTLRKSSSSSLTSIPIESPGACARVSAGKTELSTFPSLPPQPSKENPSIVKNSADNLVKSGESEENFTKNSIESSNEPLHIALSGIDDLSVDLERLQKLQENLQHLREKEEKLSSIFASSGEIIPNTASSSKDSSALSCLKENLKVEQEENFTDEHVTLPNHKEVTDDVASSTDAQLTSDSNNNQIKLDFLSPHTSQRKLPPKFYNSTNSLNRSECFEASSRLKRLEERFKGFSYTKKLLRDSKHFSKSEEILSSYGTESEFSRADSLNSKLIPFEVENSLRQLKACGSDKKDYVNNFSSDKSKFLSLNENGE